MLRGALNNWHYCTVNTISVRVSKTVLVPEVVVIVTARNSCFMSVQGELLGGIEDMKFGQIRILMTPNRYELSENFKTANYHSYQAVTTNDMSEGKLHITSTCIRSLYETTTNDPYENGTTLAHKNAVTTLGGHNGATVQKYYPKRRLENSVKNAQAVMSVVYNNNSTPASVPDSGEPPAPTSGGSESDDDIAPVRASYDTGSHTHQIYDDDEAPPALIPLRNFRHNEDLLPALVNDANISTFYTHSFQ